MPERCDIRSEVCLREESDPRKWKMYGHHLEPPARKITATASVECSGEDCAQKQVLEFSREGSAPQVMPDGSDFGDTAARWARASLMSSCPKQQ